MEKTEELELTAEEQLQELILDSATVNIYIIIWVEVAVMRFCDKLPKLRKENNLSIASDLPVFSNDKLKMDEIEVSPLVNRSKNVIPEISFAVAMIEKDIKKWKKHLFTQH